MPPAKQLLRPKKLAVLLLVLGLITTSTLFISNQKNTLQQFLLAQAGGTQEEQIFNLINQERIKFNLNPPRINPKSTQSATLKANDMDQKKYFAHSSPEGGKWSDFVINSGYDYTISAENLARNYTSPKTVVESWLNSPTHRDNVLNPKLKDTGIAILDKIDNSARTIYIVQHFGSLE